MLTKFFLQSSPYTRRARLAAVLWTLLIFIACLWPGKDIPDIQVPFIDKWVHFVLFGVFSFLWLCGYPRKGWQTPIVIFLVAVFTGWLVEELQGALPALGRTKDMMDALADSVGGLLGVLVFIAARYLSGANKV
ncbi:MAG: VanZ family protein [Flavipsychrobacter sp.]|nr:VanZ family protein [Flavipsychrobacter sp.]